LIETLPAKGFGVTCLPWQSADGRVFLTAQVISYRFVHGTIAAAPGDFHDWIVAGAAASWSMTRAAY